jgi:hypothetical protein
VNRWKDTLGIAASIACGIHCALTPVFLAFLPSLRLTGWMASPLFHQVAAIACVSLVALSIWPTFVRFRDFRVLGLSSLGLSLVLAAAFFMPDTCCSHGSHAMDVSVTPVSSPTAKLVSVSSAESFDSSSNPRSIESSQFLLTSSQKELDSTSPGDRLRLRAAADSTHAHEHSDANSFAALLQPWLTPLGGAFLVLAHGMNLRRRVKCSSKCSCKSHSKQATLTAPTAAAKQDTTLAA